MKRATYKTAFIDYLQTMLQKYRRGAEENLQERYKSLIDKTGVIISEVDSDGNLSSDLRVDKINNTKIYINPGKAIDINFEVVPVDIGFEFDVLEAGTSMYAVIRYDITKSEPVEKTLPYYDGDLNTWQEDHYEFYLKYPEELLLGSDEIILAELVFDGNGLKEVIDKRRDRMLKIKSSLLSADILFRQPAPPAPIYLRIGQTGLDKNFRDYNSYMIAIPFIPTAWIEIKWNDYGVGQEADEKFRVLISDATTPEGEFPHPIYEEDEWVGWYMRLNGKDYKVLGNSGTCNAYFTFDEPCPIVGSDTEFILHCGGQGYNTVTKVHLPGDIKKGSPDGPWFRMAESTITNRLQQSCTFRGLAPGEKIQFEVASIGSWYQEDFSNFTQGTFECFGYSQLVSNEVIDSVTVIPKDSGFDVKVVVKELYREKIMASQIAWTDNGDTPSFSSSQCHTIPTGVESAGQGEAGFLGIIDLDPDRKYKVTVRCIDTLGRKTVEPYVSAEEEPSSHIRLFMEEMVRLRGVYEDAVYRIEAIEQPSPVTKVHIYGPETSSKKHISGISGDWAKAITTQDFGKNEDTNHIHLRCTLNSNVQEKEASLKMIVTYPDDPPTALKSGVITTEKDFDNDGGLSVSIIFDIIKNITGICEFDLYYKGDGTGNKAVIRGLSVEATS